jgi:hypothetical protein
LRVEMPIPRNYVSSRFCWWWIEIRKRSLSRFRNMACICSGVEPQVNLALTSNLSVASQDGPEIW